MDTYTVVVDEKNGVTTEIKNVTSKYLRNNILEFKTKSGDFYVFNFDNVLKYAALK